MTKILILLVFAQTILSLLLFGKIDALEDEMLLLTQVESSVPAHDYFARQSTEDEATDSLTTFGEESLRRIIREELAAQSFSESGSDRSGETVMASVDPAEMRDRRAAIAQQVDYYSSIGQISEIEMQALQVGIAALDSSGRREMLSKLTRAMNAGTIKGRL